MSTATPMSPDRVRDALARAVEAGATTDTRTYAAGLIDELRSGGDGRFLWTIEHFIGLCGMRDCDVLDVGCGFGWTTLGVAMAGANRVVGVDIREYCIRQLNDQVHQLQGEGVEVLAEGLVGDICDPQLLAGRTFDAILCNQTIEHVHDLDAMFARWAELLRPGGRYLVTNDNNLRNRRHFAEIRTMWERRDRSWEYVGELKRTRPDDNRDAEPFAVTRARFVRDARPDLNDREVESIVAATAGMVRREIEELARGYAPGAPLPTPPPDSWCRDPATGEYCERQLDPFAVAERLRACGLSAEVRHGFRKAPLRWLNRPRLRPISDALFQLRPLFFITGRRPA